MRSLLFAALLIGLTTASAIAAIDPTLELNDALEPDVSVHAPHDPIPYVIVTSKELKPEFERLAHAHTRDGLRAAVWTLETIRKNYPVARDEAERIRLFLKDAHENLGARWLLIGGNANVIPIRVTRPGDLLIPNLQVPTDQYYACLDGTWNADDDDVWGETATDQVDVDPELIVGRAPVQTKQDAKRFVARTLAVLSERHAPESSSVLLAAEYAFLGLDFGRIAEGLRPTFEALPGVELRRLYENIADWPGSMPESRAALVAELERGPALAVLLGRGDYQRFSAGPDLFTVDDASELEASRPTIVMFVSALTCSLGVTPCLGEALMNASHAQIVAVIGPTCLDFSSFLPGQFFDQVYAQGARTIGEALNRVLEAVAAQSPGRIRESLQGAVILGDPALPMRPASAPGAPSMAALPASPGERGVSLALPSSDVSGLSGTAAAVDAMPAASASLAIRVAHPRGDDNVHLTISVPARVAGSPSEVAVFDAVGRRVRVLERDRARPGDHSIVWDATTDAGDRVSDGVYFVSVRAGDQRVSKAVAIVR